MDKARPLMIFVALYFVGVVSGREYCMTWSVSGKDPTGKTFRYSFTDPFRPAFCGNLPVYQEEGVDKDMKVLFYNNLEKVWQIGEKIPKCEKDKITGSKLLYTSKISELDMQKLDGTHTWYTEDKDDVSILFTCAQRAMAAGAFDNFKNVEL